MRSGKLASGPSGVLALSFPTCAWTFRLPFRHTVIPLGLDMNLERHKVAGKQPDLTIMNDVAVNVLRSSWLNLEDDIFFFFNMLSMI